MSDPDPDTDAAPSSDTRLAILLAMAMFVLVVDTSLMNVSISSVVRDLDTTVSGVQSAIALEALVSAAFILIGSKVGDLIGRKRAYVLGLLAVCHRRVGDDPGTGPDRHRGLLGDHRRPGRLPAAARDAVAGARELRGRRAAQGVRAGRRRGGHRGRRRPPARRLHHDVPVLARRVRDGGGDHRSRALRDPAGQGRAVHRPAHGRRGRRAALGAGHGRTGAEHPGVAGGRRVRPAADGRRRRRPRAPWPAG